MLTALAASFTGRLGVKLMGCAFAVCSLPAFLSCEPGFLRGEFMRRALLVSGFAAHAGDLSLLGSIHCGKPAVALLLSHDVSPLSDD